MITAVNHHHNGYTPLPFAHTDRNIFAAELKQENTFRECMILLIKDWKQLFNLKSNTSCVLLLIAAGCNVGAYNGFSSILQDMMSPIGFTESTIGYIGASSMISQIIGALIGGQVVDRYFSGKLKKCILFVQCIDIMWFTIGCLVLPNILNGNEVIIFIPNDILRLLVFLSIAISLGLAYGVTLFLYFELLAEIAYPIAEASLANAVYVVGLPLMILLIQIGSINTSITCMLSLVCVVMAYILDTFVVERYGRPKDEPFGITDGGRGIIRGKDENEEDIGSPLDIEEVKTLERLQTQRTGDESVDSVQNGDDTRALNESNDNEEIRLLKDDEDGTNIVITVQDQERKEETPMSSDTYGQVTSSPNPFAGRWSTGSGTDNDTDDDTENETDGEGKPSSKYRFHHYADFEERLFQ